MLRGLRSRFVMLGSAVLFAGATGSSPAAPDAAYVQSFEKWKAEQIDDLKQNWLPLAGLYWLKPGANSFGTAPENAVVFPKGPAHAGEFDLEGKDVTIKAASGRTRDVGGQAADNSEAGSRRFGARLAGGDGYAALSRDRARRTRWDSREGHWRARPLPTSRD